MNFVARIVSVEGSRITLELDDQNLNAYFKTEASYHFDVTRAKKGRTLEQNRFYWALVTILAYHIYGESGWEEVVHEELLTMYSPKVGGKLSKRPVPKRSKELTTVEFAHLIEGVFKELAESGAGVYQADDIRRYWTEWRAWRAEQETDPVHYESKDELIERQIFCEACGCYLGEKKTVAHIKSVGAGGTDEPENLLRLCDTCHLLIQHQHGFQDFVRRYPHLRGKVEKALKSDFPIF